MHVGILVRLGHCHGVGPCVTAPASGSFVQRGLKELPFLFVSVPLNAGRCGACGPGFASPLDAMKGKSEIQGGQGRALRCL